MLIKVCGMKIPSQIDDLANIADFVGYIFYAKSSRFVQKAFENESSKKVGVFVNESISVILDKTKNENLDLVQLHGSESPEFCKKIKNKVPVIKAFGINDEFQFSKLEEYLGCVDYFLFDTKTSLHGGSGKQFDWQLLKIYDLDIPFFLSGGISSNSIDKIKEFKHPQLIGIDINSGFELSPANKNIEQIKTFINEVKS